MVSRDTARLCQSIPYAWGSLAVHWPSTTQSPQEPGTTRVPARGLTDVAARSGVAEGLVPAAVEGLEGLVDRGGVEVPGLVVVRQAEAEELLERVGHLEVDLHPGLLEQV